MIPPAGQFAMLQPVGLLALCPLLARAGTLLTAISIGVLYLLALVLVSATMAALGRSVSPDARVLTLLVVSGAWVTLLDLALQAADYPLWAALDIYLPLIAANSLVLAAGEQSLRGGSVKDAARRGMKLGVQALLWLIPLGMLREALGTGALMSDGLLIAGVGGPWPVLPLALPLLQGPAGGLLLLGLACAATTALVRRERAHR